MNSVEGREIKESPDCQSLKCSRFESMPGRRRQDGNLDEVSVNVYGDTAVSFTSQKEKSTYEGKDTSGPYHFTDTWVKKDGKWQVVASHGTRFDRPTAGEKAKAK